MVPGEIGILPEHREVTGTPPGGYWAYMGLEGEEGRRRRGLRAPPLPSPNRTREGGRRPRFPSPLPPLSPFSYSYLERRESYSRWEYDSPLGAPSLAGRLLPLGSFIYGGGGAPQTHKLIYGSFLSRVRCPLPPYSTSVISL